MGFPPLELSLYKIKEGDMQGLCANQLALYSVLEFYSAYCFRLLTDLVVRGAVGASDQGVIPDVEARQRKRMLSQLPKGSSDLLVFGLAVGRIYCTLPRS